MEKEINEINDYLNITCSNNPVEIQERISVIMVYFCLLYTSHILKAYRRISLSEALKQAWFLAKKQQKEYRKVEEEKKSFKPVFNASKGNVLKAFFADKYTNYDSYWR